MQKPNQPDPIDTPIDRALTALNSATPPEGMEARILARLAYQAAPRLSVWSRLAPHSAWLRGALTGALAATAACALAFYITRTSGAPPRFSFGASVATSAQVPHPSRKLGSESAEASSSAGQNSSSALKGRGFSRAVSATLSDGALAPEAASLCLPQTATVRLAHSSRSYRDEWDEKSPRLIPASFAPSKPAPPAPLTAQERALIQFARTATPAELAALNPAAEEKSDADREAAFQKFFAPSPELVAAQKAEEQAIHAQPAETATPQPTDIQGAPQPTEVRN